MFRRYWKDRFYRACFLTGAAAGLILFVGTHTITTRRASAIVVTTPELPIQVGEVTSGMILDGTIADSDISAAAAISADKATGTAQHQFITTGTQQFDGVKTFSSFPEVPTSTPTGAQAVSATYLSSISSQNSYSIRAGEDLSTGDAVYVPTSTISTVGPNSNSGTTLVGLGCSTTNGDEAEQQAQAFRATSTGNHYGIGLYPYADSGTGGQLIISIQASSSGNPSGTMLASTTIDGSAMSTSSASLFEVGFNAPFSQTAGNDYFIVASSSQGAAAPCRYVLNSANTNVYNGGAAWRLRSGSWALDTTTLDQRWYFLNSSSSPVVLKTSANTADATSTFVGFANATTTQGSLASIIINGMASTFSNITSGLNYYLSNTAGAIQTSPASSTRRVGIGVATSSLLITNIW